MSRERISNLLIALFAVFVLCLTVATVIDERKREQKLDKSIRLTAYVAHQWSSLDGNCLRACHTP